MKEHAGVHCRSLRGHAGTLREMWGNAGKTGEYMGIPINGGVYKIFKEKEGRNVIIVGIGETVH